MPFFKNNKPFVFWPASSAMRFPYSEGPPNLRRPETVGRGGFCRDVHCILILTFLLPFFTVAQTQDQLIQEAEEILKAGRIYSVTFKEVVPPSGNMHDYMSQGPYWWPDPKKPDGLPYIRRDGELNPEIKKISDHDQHNQLANESYLLAQTWKHTKEDKYALWASHLIRTWFINEKTKQTPNLEFGQGIPGRTVGRGIGIIETTRHPKIQEAATILLESPYWNKEDHAALQQWFTDYLNWLLTSEKGIDEGNWHNNHGSWYDVQVAAAALFIGKEEIAKAQVARFKTRLASQMAEDGSQPHELARTKSWNYSNMNLNAWIQMARLADQVGIDLWNYESPNGRSIELAVEWLFPYAAGEKEWDYKQITPMKFDTTTEVFYWAAKNYPKSKFKLLATKLIKTNADGLFLLTHPTL